MEGHVVHNEVCLNEAQIQPYHFFFLPEIDIMKYELSFNMVDIS
jgi:hypothetical protein